MNWNFVDVLLFVFVKGEFVDFIGFFWVYVFFIVVMIFGMYMVGLVFFFFWVGFVFFLFGWFIYGIYVFGGYIDC